MSFRFASQFSCHDNTSRVFDSLAACPYNISGSLCRAVCFCFPAATVHPGLQSIGCAGLTGELQMKEIKRKYLKDEKEEQEK
jgi:hypothetical protein